MKVCYFGIYDPSYARNRILIDGLLQNGVEVIECQSRAHGFSKYLELVKNHRKIKDSYDVMVVGFPGYQAMILARFLTRKPIIFDSFSSLYDSMVWDRKQESRWSIKALYFWLLDRLSMGFADVILFDTKEHIEYAAGEFHVPREKFRRLWIGADTSVFTPNSKTTDPQGGKLRETQERFGLSAEGGSSFGGKDLKRPNLAQGFPQFCVLFYGTFIPLQGIEYIIGAAKRLSGERLHFSIVGNGQMKKKVLRLTEMLGIRNISFIDFLPHDALVERIAAADICLGIFGNTNKTKRVIPNKVYECLAMKKAVITADTPAARELLGDKDVCFVKTADSASLAEGILRLKNDRDAIETLAQNGYDTFTKNATPKILGKELKDIVDGLVKMKK